MTSTTPFLSRLVNEPHAVVFGGQSTPWTAALADAMDDPTLAADLHAQVLAADRLLTPVAADLLAVTGHPTDIFGFKPSGASLGAAADASVSVEGIALTQLAAIIDAVHLGYNPASKPVALLGHSQGIIGVHMARELQRAGSLEAAQEPIEEILAVARLIGVAGTRQARLLGLHAKLEGATPMLSVKGANREQTETLIARVPATRGPISIAVENAPDHQVLSGYPEDLALFALAAGK